MIKRCKLFASVFMALLSMNVLADTSLSKNKRIHIGITDRDTMIGLNFLPPDEDGWKMTRTGLDVSLKKSGKFAGEDREIEAYLIMLDAPISPISGYIKKLKKNVKESVAASKSFKIARLEVTESAKDKRCVRVYLLLEYIRPVQVANTKQKKWQERYTLSCGSLKYKKHGFEVNYNHRYLDAQKEAGIESQANKILESVIIVDK